MNGVFGDGVCANIEEGQCHLIPQAQAWMDEENKGMDGGHCFGMSATSLALYKKALDPASFDVSDAAHLEFTSNSQLQEAIAEPQATQLLPMATSGHIKGTPKQIVDKLIEVLRPDNPETYAVAFFMPDGSKGHAVTPYAVEDKGDGKVDILIYDNNFPMSTRVIEVDRSADTWRYETAANPAEPAEPYFGDAATQTLDIRPTKPTEPWSQQHEFPYYGNQHKGGTGAAAAQGAPAVLVYLDGDRTDHGHLLITDDAGRRTGFVDGKRVNEIPGATMQSSLADKPKTDLEPEYSIPAGIHFTVTVDGSGLKKKKEDETSVTILADTYSVSVDGIKLRPDTKAVIDPAPNGERLDFTSSDSQAPQLEFGMSYDHADYIFTVARAAVNAGGTISAALPLDRWDFTLDATKAGAPGDYGLAIERLDNQDVRKFQRNNVKIASGATGTLDYQAWDTGQKALPFTVTNQGQQTTQDLGES
ncbi:hypothetical protein [Nocardia altamirensis]|uniref:hypothetical protein n=1 Tax=Nocardia altamirensis TaxID=472158 RepID=UPI00114D111D|nr:hypothetical protein [Nocardia altamirensis]